MKTSIDTCRRFRLFEPSLGFTLVEMLVVTAIIAILAGLLLPVFTKAKDKTRSMKCLNNLKQMGLGRMIYIDDTSKSFPIDWNRDSDSWPHRLSHSSNLSDDILICPAAGRPAKQRFTNDYSSGNVGTAWVPPSGSMIPPSSYGINAWTYSLKGNFRGGKLDWAVSSGLAGNFYGDNSLAEVGSQTPVFGDCNWIDAWPFEDERPVSNLVTGSTEGQITRFLLARHGSASKPVPTKYDVSKPFPGAINIVFMDGHSSAVALEGLWGLKWHRNYNPPAVRPGRSNIPQ